MRSVTIKMSSTEVKAEVRQLKCKVTNEMVQDINSYHSLDIDEFARELVRQQRVGKRKNAIKNLFT